MFIINQKEMYIHIPKTSGTNLRQVFLNSSHDIVDYDEVGKIKKLSTPARDLFWNGRDIQDILEHPFLRLSEVDYLTTNHSPLWVWQKTGDWDGHKIITIVRNPYTRAVSMYKQVLRLFGVVVNQEMDFDEFLSNSAIQSIIERFPHSHKSQQVDYLKDTDGNINVDRFYKLETELNIFAQEYDLKDIHTQKYNSGNYSKNYSEIYNDFLIDWVKETYADDFKFFGYDTEPFWM